jgi:hypothetical protein
MNPLKLELTRRSFASCAGEQYEKISSHISKGMCEEIALVFGVLLGAGEEFGFRNIDFRIGSRTDMPPMLFRRFDGGAATVVVGCWQGCCCCCCGCRGGCSGGNGRERGACKASGLLLLLLTWLALHADQSLICKSALVDVSGIWDSQTMLQSGSRTEGVVVILKFFFSFFPSLFFGGAVVVAVVNIYIILVRLVAAESSHSQLLVLILLLG